MPRMDQHTTTPVPVAPEVFEGLQAVRFSGLTNMLDRARVAELAEELDHSEAARWIREHRALFAAGIFAGFAVEEEDPR